MRQYRDDVADAAPAQELWRICRLTRMGRAAWREYGYSSRSCSRLPSAAGTAAAGCHAAAERRSACGWRLRRRAAGPWRRGRGELSPHLLHAHEITAPAIARLLGHRLDGDLTIGVIRAVDTDVEGIPEARRFGPVMARRRLLRVDIADALCACLESRCPSQPQLWPAALDEAVQERLALLQPALGEVEEHAARADVVMGEAVTREGFEQVQDDLALAETPEHRRRGAQVQPICAEAHQVRRDAVELDRQHADVLGALRHFDARQPFDGAGYADSLIIGLR